MQKEAEDPDKAMHEELLQEENEKKAKKDQNKARAKGKGKGKGRGRGRGKGAKRQEVEQKEHVKKDDHEPVEPPDIEDSQLEGPGLMAMAPEDPSEPPSTGKKKRKIGRKNSKIGRKNSKLARLRVMSPSSSAKKQKVAAEMPPPLQPVKVEVVEIEDDEHEANIPKDQQVLNNSASAEPKMRKKKSNRRVSKTKKTKENAEAAEGEGPKTQETKSESTSGTKRGPEAEVEKENRQKKAKTSGKAEEETEEEKKRKELEDKDIDPYDSMHSCTVHIHRSNYDMDRSISIKNPFTVNS